MKKILICGGDGFCGWPTALYLSRRGYEVAIVDNLSRRKIDIDLGTDSLTPITSIEQRLDCWNHLLNKKILFYNIDIAQDYFSFFEILKDCKPEVIIHFAEQRSAPYSMKNEASMRYTVDNNLNATNNILCSMVHSGKDIHLIHLGTMGVYGYKTVDATIPEGYLPIKITKEDGTLMEFDILYPADPGSIYHMTKTQDALLFYFYNKNYNIPITDLHQGIVWGTNTDETLMHQDLINRFDYDGDYGTVLNRFLMQAAIGQPLTVYGTGGQTRGFIHLRNTVECIRLAVENKPRKGNRVHILNQITETHRVLDLARRVQELTDCKILFYKNPRKENQENELRVSNDTFLSLGLEPVKLNTHLLVEVKDIAQKYGSRCRKEKIFCTSLWTNNNMLDFKGHESFNNQALSAPQCFIE